MAAVGRLAFGVAHDFNNLLTAILGYTELLLAKTDPGGDLAADLNGIRDTCLRGARLTRQLLAFSRTPAFSPHVINLNDVVRGVEHMLTRVIGEDIRLEIAVAPRLSATRADPGQIEQLLVNLVLNARDAMPGGGVIPIRTANEEIRATSSGLDRRRAGRYVTLTVEDTGCGMTPDVLAHAFEPFFTTKTAGRGTGLGLSTVQEIVTTSGGHVVVDSQMGRGTSVTAYFPALDDSQPSAAAAVSDPPDHVAIGNISRCVRDISSEHGTGLRLDGVRARSGVGTVLALRLGEENC